MPNESPGLRNDAKMSEEIVHNPNVAVMNTADIVRLRACMFLANVPDDLLPLAFGTKGCSAADVPKVPKAWELGQSAR